RGPEPAAGLLAIGAVLFDRPEFKTLAGKYQEAAYWLLGPEGRAQFDMVSSASEDAPLRSHAFPDSGYYLLQCGQRKSADHISVFFDCGELGFQSIAAHGHADALSFTLRAFGQDILVDPGTYDYFRYPEWRTYFRTTRAHNTVVIDNRDQSEMLGPFLWGRRAKARCLTWEPGPCGGQVVGEHDGYTNLNDPVVHRRTLNLDGQARVLTIIDDIVAHGPHRVQIFFHFATDCNVAAVGANRLAINTDDGTVVFMIDARLTIELLKGNEQPIAGWVSHRYHHKEPAITVIASGECLGSVQFTCSMIIGETS